MDQYLREEKREEPVPVWESLDYRNDAIIEASAGTGKTYTLSRIVLKLVRDGLQKKGDIQAREILLVTFTEKAAGELRDRIRKALAEERCLPKDFDEMVISTIHAFCKKLLNEYAFENGVPISQKIQASDSELKREALYRTLRSSAFRERMGARFSEIMLLSGCSSAETLLDKVSERFDCPKDLRQRQLYRADEELKKTLGNPENPWKWLLADMVMVQPKKGDTSLKEAQDALLARVGEIAGSYPQFLEIGSESYLRALEGIDWEVKVKDGRKPSSKGGVMRNTFKEFHKFWEALSKSSVSLLEEPLLEMGELEFRQLKEDMGTLSFDDLIRQAKQIVEKEAGLEKSPLLERLRKRYRIALVDEFQDTDDNQWTIFKTLFSHKNNPEGFLMVVGDPKQAIYSFRGADIGTYLQARSEIGHRESLKETYRSTPELVEIFNRLFTTPSWFGEMAVGQNRITYEEVSYPARGNPSFDHIQEDRTQRGALTLLESLPQGETQGNKNMCIPCFMKNAIREMKRILAGAPTLLFKGESRAFPPLSRYRDFCFLVPTKAEAEIVKRELARQGVPFTQYKEAGLYTSPEAESVLAILDFLDQPSKSGYLAALLQTPFYGISPDRVEEALENPDPSFYTRVDRWQVDIRARKWSRLFDSLMNDTRLTRPGVNDFGFDRRVAGVRQIFDQLLIEKGHCANRISEFSDYLRQLRKEDGESGEGGSLLQLESEEDRVRIMTMHACKGLEFPAVFVPSGFSKKKAREFQDASEQEAEIRRLFYVALTRAQYKLYLPWSKEAGKGGIGSKGSPLCNGFLAEAIRRAFDGEPEREVVELPASLDAPLPLKPREDEKIEIPTFRRSPNDHLHWDSFTSLNRHRNQPEVLLSNEDKRDEEDEAVGVPEGIQPDLQLSTLVPRTAQSGTVFHEVMEALCKSKNGFKIGKKSLEPLLREGSYLRVLVARRMEANGLSNRKEGEESTERSLARMVWVALNTELALGGKSFFLRDVEPEDRLAEVNFVLSERTIYGDDLGREGVFNGSIDLLIRPEGRSGPCYILDWKTNFLPEGYGEKAVRQAMDSAGYPLQYRLYTLAASKWLGEEKIKGIFYLFVRGGEHGEQSGIYSEMIDNESLAMCYSEVLKAVKGGN